MIKEKLPRINIKNKKLLRFFVDLEVTDSNGKLLSWDALSKNYEELHSLISDDLTLLDIKEILIEITGEETDLYLFDYLHHAPYNGCFHDTMYFIYDSTTGGTHSLKEAEHKQKQTPDVYWSIIQLVLDLDRHDKSILGWRYDEFDIHPIDDSVYEVVDDNITISMWSLCELLGHDYKWMSVDGLTIERPVAALSYRGNGGTAVNLSDFVTENQLQHHILKDMLQYSFESIVISYEVGKLFNEMQPLVYHHVPVDCYIEWYKSIGNKHLLTVYGFSEGNTESFYPEVKTNLNDVDVEKADDAEQFLWSEGSFADARVDLSEISTKDLSHLLDDKKVECIDNIVEVFLR